MTQLRPLISLQTSVASFPGTNRLRRDTSLRVSSEIDDYNLSGFAVVREKQLFNNVTKKIGVIASSRGR